MGKNKKFIDKYSRSMSECENTATVFYVDYNPTHKVISTESVWNEDLQCNVKRPVFKTFDPRELHKGMKCSDFRLENLISSGNLDLLKPTTMNGSFLGMSDHVEGSAAKLVEHANFTLSNTGVDTQ